MDALQRITTAYSETQDRLRLAGEGSGGSAVVVWLTQRLLNRLVPHLCQWLEEQSTVATASALVQATQQGIAQSFAQQAASAALTPQPPVQPTREALEALAHSVDVRTTTGEAAAVTLVFKDEEGSALAQVALAPMALRQWLGIVYLQYRQALWPTGSWPAWMEEAHQPTAATAPAGKMRLH